MDYIYLIAAFLSSLVLGKWTVKYLRKLKMGQEIREEGPKSHYIKAGTPTMGGIFFIAVYVVISIIFMIIKNTNIKMSLFLLISPLLFAGIGFLDDYEKIAKKNNLGLTAKQKLVLQIFFSLVMTLYVRFVLKFEYDIYIPFLKRPVDIGLFYIPFMVFLITGSTNAVNLTDGLDGLCGGVSSVIIVALGIVARGIGIIEVDYMSHILSGALLGFLVYNIYPAKVFMGDTGSLFLGGYLAAAFMLLKQPIHLAMLGIVYVVETLSVIIQVLYFKKTGKRFFKMAPIHHHFEMKGHHEKNIVTSFVVITFIISVLYIILMRYGIL